MLNGKQLQERRVEICIELLCILAKTRVSCFVFKKFKILKEQISSFENYSNCAFDCFDVICIDLQQGIIINTIVTQLKTKSQISLYPVETAIFEFGVLYVRNSNCWRLSFSQNQLLLLDHSERKGLVYLN